MNRYQKRFFIANGVSANEFGACLATIPEIMEAKVKAEKDIPLWSSFSINCSFCDEKDAIAVDVNMKGYLDSTRISEVISEVDDAFQSMGFKGDAVW